MQLLTRSQKVTLRSKAHAILNKATTKIKQNCELVKPYVSWTNTKGLLVSQAFNVYIWYLQVTSYRCHPSCASSVT